MNIPSIPVIPKKGPTWATECPGRSPKFKVHSQRGHALSAVNNQAYNGDQVTLYEMVGDMWVPRVHVPKRACMTCGRTGGLHPVDYKIKPTFLSEFECSYCSMARHQEKRQFVSTYDPDGVPLPPHRDMKEFLVDPDSDFVYYSK